MNNEELINKRWKTTEQTLRDALKKINKLSIATIDEIIDLYKSLDITYQDLNKPISKADKRKLDQRLKKWKKEGITLSYLTYLVLSKKKYTYSDLLEILIYGIYAEKQEEVFNLSKEVYMTVAEDIYNQALEEIPKKPKKISLTWDYVYSLLIVPVYNKLWKEYLQLLTLTHEQEMYKLLTGTLQQDKEVTEDNLKTLVDKQMHRILSINDDKFSGALSDTSRMLGNEIYTEPFKDKDLQVRFIAEMDKRTTKMCKSLNNQLFYVNDYNKFYRYSDIDKREVLYTVKGLEVGVNLPPIANHFHWCRSTITYLTDLDIEYKSGVYSKSDKEQYERYKKYFEDMLEEIDVDNFTKMKYNNPDKWNYLKQNYTYARHRYNAIQEKKLDPNISVKDYIDKVHEIRRELLDYELYNGETIKDISLHFYDRVIGNPEENRIGVSLDNIKDTLSNMVDTKLRENGSILIIGKNAKVSYNPQKMKLINTIPGGKK